MTRFICLVLASFALTIATALGQADLSIAFTNYAPSAYLTQDTMRFAFTTTNLGPDTLGVGDTLVFQATINDRRFDLQLNPDTFSEVPLAEPLPPGDSLAIDPGVIIPSQTYAFFPPGTNRLAFGIVAYGVGKAVITKPFVGDPNPDNNTATATDRHPDLAIGFTKYAKGTTLAHGDIQSAFYIKNRGPSDLVAGDTLFVAARFNGAVTGVDITKPEPVTKIGLPNGLPAGDSLVVDPGFLIGYRWLLDFEDTVRQITFNTDSLQLGLLVYGVGPNSVGPGFPSDPNPSDNSTFVTYKNYDLAVSFDRYEPGETIAGTDTIQAAFTVTNRGPIPVAQGDTLYLSAVLNDSLFSLSLVAGEPTRFALPAALPVGGALPFDPGWIDGRQTLGIVGGDSLSFGIKVWGVGHRSYLPLPIANPPDANIDDNLAVVGYSIVTGLDTEARAGLAKAYPVPARGVVYFATQGQPYQRATISTMGGKACLSRPLTPGSPLDISGLRPGLYLYVLEGATHRHVGKLLVK